MFKPRNIHNEAGIILSQLTRNGRDLRPKSEALIKRYVSLHVKERIEKAKKRGLEPISEDEQERLEFALFVSVCGSLVAYQFYCEDNTALQEPTTVGRLAELIEAAAKEVRKNHVIDPEGVLNLTKAIRGWCNLIEEEINDAT